MTDLPAAENVPEKAGTMLRPCFAGLRWGKSGFALQASRYAKTSQDKSQDKPVPLRKQECSCVRLVPEIV